MTNKTEELNAAEKLEQMANIETSALFSQRYALRNGAATIRNQADRIAQLEAELITQTNRAASAEQQRWEMANALNTEARAQLAQRQVPADAKWKCGNEYLPFHPSASHVNPDYRDGWNDCYQASPTPPQRERDHALLAMCKLLEPHLFQHDKLEPMHCDGPNTSKRVYDAIALSNKLYEAAHGIKGADQ